jgi:hypothetical protein
MRKRVGLAVFFGRTAEARAARAGPAVAARGSAEARFRLEAEPALAGAFRAEAALSVTTAAEPVAAAEDAFLRDLVAGGRTEATVLAGLALDLGGGSGLLDFIKHGVREACHKAGTTMAEAHPARNQKIGAQKLIPKEPACQKPPPA